MSFAVTMDWAKYRATLHYEDCSRLALANCVDVPLPYNVKIRLCGTCQPTVRDILRAPPGIAYDPHSHSPGRLVERVVPMDMELAENRAAQRSLGYGRKEPAAGEGWG